MVKLSRAVVERLVLVCLYMQNRDYNAYELMEEALGIRPSKGAKWNPRDVLSGIFNGDGLTHEGSSWHELLDEMAEQLGSRNAGGEAHHPALIEQVAEILQGPYAKSVLAGRALQSLRRAILLPEEMGKVGESARKELHCSNCGKNFVEGEMLSFSNGREGEGANFYCSRCMMPTYTACRQVSGCDGGSPLDSKMLQKSIGTKPDCGQHNNLGVIQPEANPFAEDGPIGAWVEVGQGVLGQPQPPDLFARARQNAAQIARAGGDRPVAVQRGRREPR